MSKPIQAINRYKADLRELQFLLFEQFKLGELLGKEPFESWGVDEVQVDARPSATGGCARSSGRSTPSADAEGCQLEDGKVITPTGFKEAWKKLYEAGWKSIARRRRVRRRRRAARAPGPRRGDDLRRQHGVRDVPGARLRRRRGHRVLRHRRAEARSTARACSPGSGAAPCASPSRRPGATSAQRARPPRRATPTAPTPSAARRSSSPAATTTSPRTSSTSCSRASTARRPAPRGSRSSSCRRSASTPTARSASRTTSTSANIEHKMGINGSATCVLNFGDERQVHRLARRRRRASSIRACRRCSR